MRHKLTIDFIQNINVFIEESSDKYPQQILRKTVFGFSMSQSSNAPFSFSTNFIYFVELV